MSKHIRQRVGVLGLHINEIYASWHRMFIALQNTYKTCKTAGLDSRLMTCHMFYVIRRLVLNIYVNTKDEKPCNLII